MTCAVHNRVDDVGPIINVAEMAWCACMPSLTLFVVVRLPFTISGIPATIMGDRRFFVLDLGVLHQLAITGLVLLHAHGVHGAAAAVGLIEAGAGEYKAPLYDPSRPDANPGPHGRPACRAVCGMQSSTDERDWRRHRQATQGGMPIMGSGVIEQSCIRLSRKG